MSVPLSSSPPAEGSPYAKHIPALDGIRGLAILGVMASHLFPGTASTPFTIALRAVLGFGAVGVDLFFVLSGFLITGILYDSLGDRHFFRKFYARRILRIFPLYYGVLACFSLMALVGEFSYHGELRSLALFLQNTGWVATPIYAYTGPPALPLAHFWSLAIEEQFYFVWSLGVFALRRRRALLFACGLMILLCPCLRCLLWLHGWGYQPVHNNTLLRSDTLLAGAALALLVRSRWHDLCLGWGGTLFGVGALLTLILFLHSGNLAAADQAWPRVALGMRYSAVTLMFTGLLASSLKPGPVARSCSVAVLRFFGKYSYGLYVLHLLVFGLCDRALRLWLAVHLSPNKAVGIALTGVLCLALSVLSAVLSFQLFEKHFLKLKRFFAYSHRTKQERHLAMTGDH